MHYSEAEVGKHKGGQHLQAISPITSVPQQGQKLQDSSIPDAAPRPCQLQLPPFFPFLSDMPWE